MTTEVALVVGTPVAHSLSPAMHNAEFRRRGEPRSYGAREVQPGGLARFVESLRGSAVVGLSVTMPLKEEAYALAIDRDSASTRCRSANTISLAGNRVRAWNTDGDGCVRALESHGATVGGATCVVIGAGGTGRAVVEALGRRGAREVIVVNRSSDAAANAASCADQGRVGSESDVSSADIVVNTTPVGMNGVAGAQMPIDPAMISDRALVLDAVYSPLVTPLLASLGQRGVRTVDGLWMLVHQAVLQQEIWFGLRSDTDVMRSAAEDELARR